MRLYWSSLSALLADKGALLLLVGAVVLYSFFYPLPYQNQVLQQVPVMIVDLDQTSLSRQIVRFAKTSSKLDVQEVVMDEGVAQQAMWQGDIQGYLILPKGMRESAVRGKKIVLPILGDGAYFLLNKTVLAGFAESVGTLSAGIEMKKLQAAGQHKLQADVSRNPVTLTMQALYNPTEGYGGYIVPAVAVVILQQTFLIGLMLFIGLLAERGSVLNQLGVTKISDVVSVLCAFATPVFLQGLYWFGWVFWWNDYPRLGTTEASSVSAVLLLLLVFSLTLAPLGLLLGMWFSNRERAMQVMLFTSIPMVFLAGFAWPAEALPEFLHWFRLLLPTTPGVQGFLKVNQFGASLTDIWPEFLHLGIMACVGWSAVLFAAWRSLRLSPQH
ncbi:ABC transporter permease [Solimicrobium silvestre]|uniref:ABC-2 family transporter protein n=1 Tax=Solimicrobium silvestre TaxID=2099400 RepID=A0A2S9GW24_9BURK|nr:ABC transporter permease [Solimicrobium silvestre]PRC91898.1 ABC-2 family transporter protein [Solimicrobium silvestre]